MIAIGTGGLFIACHPRAAREAEEGEEAEPVVLEPMPANPGGQSSPVRADTSKTRPKRKARNLYASWYDVPVASLAARRAPGELTAAHNHLPIGARVRVTHLGNGRSVIVRITDRGIPRGKPPLDLCRGAAEALGMVREGLAKVQMEVLPDDEANAAAQSPVSTAPSPAG